MIAKDVPQTYSHRHYSHLIGIYPLYLYNWEQQQNRSMIERSVRAWFEKDNEGRLAGYSYTGCVSMLAAMGKGNEAVNVLKRFVDGVKGRYVLGVNTMYFEGGGQAPVIETPLSAAQCIHELLMQSWGGKIRIFPALPDDWKDVAFQDLRTEGAFLVSASRKNGVTQFVRIKSLAGEPCCVRVGQGEQMNAQEGAGKLTAEADGTIRLSLKKGEEAVLTPTTGMNSLVVAPVQSAGPANAFGLKAGAR